MKDQTHPEDQLEQGTYEILQNRLNKHGEDLLARINQLNESRKETFGSLDTALIANARINTANNSIARDIFALGDKCILGYNVLMGLKATVEVADVFSIFEYKDHQFHELDLSLIGNDQFEEDFFNLYKYYRKTVFSKFAQIGPFLYMVFQVGKSVSDIKVFKWLIEGETLKYVDNRSDHEYKLPPSHDFQWLRPTREMHRDGEHPHVSILDRVFIEAVGGDLTIKIEDNTEVGYGIYAEPVDMPDQKLDDAEYGYADLGNLILLKIRPYLEEDFRYFVFNEKLQEVQRIDSIKDACILLPDDHGIIYSKGYYLQTGEFKEFDNHLRNMEFDRRVASPNGEDYLYIFYNRMHGEFILLSYNLIAQKVETPIICHGFTLYENGELCYFKAEEEATKHHVIQIWQTPYVGLNFRLEVHQDNFLYKIGNKEVVRAMAECHEVLALIGREEVYASLYQDLARKTQDILDAYYWLNNPETFHLDTPLQEIRKGATAATDEFEKVRRVKKNTEAQVKGSIQKAEETFHALDRALFSEVGEYVKGLSDLRLLRGELISLRELRYADLESIESYEIQIAERTEKLSQKCVDFLLQDNALNPYKLKVEEIRSGIDSVQKVTEADALTAKIETASSELEMLIEIVSNLKIEDSTHTTQIIEHISHLFTELNQVKAGLKKKRKAMLGTEKVAEFGAQMKLMDQAMVNYLDVCETPEKTEEYLNKMMVQLEELEGKFVDFEEYIAALTEKREEIYTAFESRKLSLIEALNKRTLSLQSAADRLLKGIEHRVGAMESVQEIHGYFAADLMVDKVRTLVADLLELGDSVKADDISSRMKSIRENTVRQLKDKQDLFVNGKDVIRLGSHAFNVNKQALDLTMVNRGGEMQFHLTGTNFFEPIDHPEFLKTRNLWGQSLVSENKTVYRAEYLAYTLFQSLKQEGGLEAIAAASEAEVLELVRQISSGKYSEGYVKGIHDVDAARILHGLAALSQHIGLLRFAPEVRSLAHLWWEGFFDGAEKATLEHRLKGTGLILQVFPESKDFGALIDDLEGRIQRFADECHLFSAELAHEAARYLFYQVSSSGDFVISHEAAKVYTAFLAHLKSKGRLKIYQQSVKNLAKEPENRFELTRNWVSAYAKQEMEQQFADFITEASVLLFLNTYNSVQVAEVPTRLEIEGLSGEHTLLADGKYTLDYLQFMQKLADFSSASVPRYQHFQTLKSQLVDAFREELRLEEFKPRVLTSFVRNKLIDSVYLPLIGDNLAKQIGVAGEAKRTDLMGMLLLISPPGYGKTTLMEYTASRLGLIFMKINGPAIGHKVTSLDPKDAPSSAAREELEKLNLAFEMGDNVMIYLDDIQHCNPEFLQKFISLCDGQRKIEGIYKGRSKTYDLRGKKVCVVMAGNPYTESGDKFRIPDMLANRADIYNLGDILGDTEAAFRLSYIENCLTSNPVLSKLSGKSQQDLYTLIKLAETGSREGLEFESNHAPEEVNEYVQILEKLFTVRDVILKVNQEYIHSAGMEDAYRTAPDFKLQGSYRDMNKIAGKVQAIMNEQELKTLLLSHYESESQTLTTGAEANLLRFKELVGWMSEEESQRWEAIKTTFQKQQKTAGIDAGNQFGMLMAQLNAFTDGLEAIKVVLEKGVQEKGNIGVREY